MSIVLNYDVNKLREAAGLDPLEELEDFEEPNYECQSCGWPAHVDDHKQHAPNYCEMCEQVRTFARISTEG
jgi:hypothetical protein